MQPCDQITDLFFQFFFRTICDGFSDHFHLRVPVLFLLLRHDIVIVSIALLRQNKIIIQCFCCLSIQRRHIFQILSAVADPAGNPLSENTLDHNCCFLDTSCNLPNLMSLAATKEKYFFIAHTKFMNVCNFFQCFLQRFLH